MKKFFLIVGILLLLVTVYLYQKDNHLSDNLKLEVNDKKARFKDKNENITFKETKKGYYSSTIKEKQEINKFSKNTAAIICAMDYDNIENINNSKFIGESIFIKDFHKKGIEYELLPYANEEGIIQYVSYKYFDKKEGKYLIAHTDCVSKLKLYSYPPISLNDALDIFEKKYPDKSLSNKDGFWYLKKQASSDPLYIFYDDLVSYAVNAKSGKIFMIEKKGEDNNIKNNYIGRYEDGKFYLKNKSGILSEDRLNIRSIEATNILIDLGCGEFGDDMFPIDEKDSQKKCSEVFIKDNINENDFNEQVEFKLKTLYGDKYIRPVNQDEINKNDESSVIEYGDLD